MTHIKDIYDKSTGGHTQIGRQKAAYLLVRHVS